MPSVAAKVRSIDQNQSKDVTINIRSNADVRDLIDHAAASEGKSRSEFMLDAARHRAEEVLLERKLFVLAASDYDNLIAMLDQKPKPNEELRKLFRKKPIWEK